MGGSLLLLVPGFRPCRDGDASHLGAVVVDRGLRCGSSFRSRHDGAGAVGCVDELMGWNLRPETVPCSDCDGAAVVRPTGPIPARCDECRLKNHRLRTKLRNRERRQTGERPSDIACGLCGEVVWVPGTVGGVPKFCRPCAEVRRKERLAKAYRRHSLKSNYGITEEAYDRLLEWQDGSCAICKRKSNARLHVDHDHATGEVRGLLCSKCNMALGGFQDNQRYLFSAFLYVARREGLLEMSGAAD